MATTPLVWINGFPGTGKLTVAKALVALSDEEILLIDNHQLIDPVEAKYSRDHPDYQQQRQLQRNRVFEKVVHNKELHSRTIVFTDFQSDNELGASVAMEYKTAAQKSGRKFMPVYLC
ncbi:hypothetical protein MMC10_005493 [Thelotrema lepadinum]|nr:hypothetical protein [Thelotrema lepadinum]